MRAAFLRLALAAALAAPAARGARPDLRFSRAGREVGLPGDVVAAVHRDRDGYVWVGTRNGLARFDGYGCVVHDYDPRDPASLSDNSIRTIAEDSRGNLWIGTNTGGLNLFHRDSGTFERFRHDPANPASISHDSVYSIVEDTSGALWVGTQEGLNRFDPGKRAFERFMHDAATPDAGPSSDYVMALHADRAGRLWIATLGGGLNVRDPQTGRFTAYRHDPGDPRSLSADKALSLAEDPSGRLWVGTYDGVNVMDAPGAFRTTLRGEGEESLTGVVVTCMAGDADGRLWAGLLDGRVLEIDPRLETVRVQDVTSGWSTAGPKPRVIAMDAAADGILWVGTWGDGLVHARPRDARFATSMGLALGLGGKAAADVTAILQDREGRLWVGSMNAGLLRRDAPDAPFVLQDKGTGVLSLAEHGGSLWMGTTTGLERRDPATGVHVAFTHDAANAASLGAGYVYALLEDRAGQLWVGTGESGLYRLREDDASFERYASAGDEAMRLSDDYVTALLEDSRGLLWVGTRSGGLNAIDREARRCTSFRPGPQDGSLSHHNVTSLREDRRGRLWIGTAGGGIDIASPSSKDVTGLRFETFGEEQGLPDDDVMGIAADTDGSTWVSTKRGIARIGADGVAVVAFGLEDGLPTLELNGMAVLSTPAALYFGSPRGLIETPTGTPMPVPQPSPLVVTAVRRQGDTDAEAARQPPVGGIVVRYRQWLSVEFAVLDLSPERNHRFEYRLGGEPSPWIDLRERREITFVDLEPGTHALQVRGRNSRGAWTTLASPLVIRVIPPFWMTSWFRAVAACALLGAVVAVHQGRMRSLRRRNAELVRLHDERERALAEARRSEERLRVLARRLEAAKEDERKALARELHDELGQSLTAVKVNLELAKRLPGDGAATAARLDDSTRIVDRLIGSVRSLSLDLRPPLMDEQGLAAALRSWLGEQARRTGLDIELAIGAPSERLAGETETAAFRIIQEAVTNAVRHADPTQVRVSVRREGERLAILVDDDGHGFDASAAVERASTGLHAGLLGMEERVRSCGGEIAFESAPGEGTTVRVWLPWTEPS